ncbi:MAG: hypothetical protein HON90_16290 [Halobacteriovoraceae bacterium]|jgi:ABC-2 type transport system permease protein|nr:hypothetical protein [Halobacteriovoraceae bacterium]
MSSKSNKNWLGQVFLMELRNLIAYRADFWVNFFGQTFFSLVVAYFLWASVFEYSGQTTINGFTIQKMIFYYLMVPLIFRIQQGHGIGFLSKEIYDGNLNKFLLYPINVYSYKLMTYLATSSFYLLQLFLILLIYNLFFYDPQIYSFSLYNLIRFSFVIVLVSISFFYLYSITELLAFWFDNIWSLGVILRFTSSFLGGALIPLTFFPTSAQTILQYTPFPYLIDFPMQTLQGTLSTESFLSNALIATGWLLVFRFISTLIWKQGQYKYTGIGI